MTDLFQSKEVAKYVSKILLLMMIKSLSDVRSLPTGFAPSRGDKQKLFISGNKTQTPKRGSEGQAIQMSPTKVKSPP